MESESESEDDSYLLEVYYSKFYCFSKFSCYFKRVATDLTFRKCLFINLAIYNVILEYIKRFSYNKLNW